MTGAAAALPVELSWTQSAGAESCIDRPALVERVERTLGHHVFVPAGRGESTLVGHIGAGPHGQGWLAVVESRKEGEATFRRELAMAGPDCRRLDEAIVLVVALMIDSTQGGGARLEVPQPAEPIRVAIGPDLAFALGMLPGPAFGFGLSSEVNVAPVWPIALSTHGWPVSRVIENGSGGRLWAWTIGVALCPVAASDRAWALFGCLGVTGGSIDATGTQLDVAKSATRAYFQTEFRLGFRFRIAGPLFGATEAGAAVPFARDTYSYTQADGSTDQLFQTAAVIPVLHARLELRVP